MRLSSSIQAAALTAATLVASSPCTALAQGMEPAPPPPPAPTAPAPAAQDAPRPPPAAPPAATGAYRYQPPQSPGLFEDPPTGPSPKAVQYRWSFEINSRTLRYANTGHEAFTTSDALPMATLGAYYGLLSQGPLSLHVGGQWSIGGSDGMARGQPTSLTVHHFGLGLLARYRITRWLYPAVRLVPLAQYTSASINPERSPSRYDSKGFAFGADATAGVHFVPFTIGDVDWPKARIWVFGEGGYSFVTKRSMRFEAHQADDDPRRLEDITLPDLSTVGYLVRIGAAVSF